MQINVFYKTSVPLGLKKTALFESAVLLALGKKLAELNGVVNVVFVSAREIHSINAQFLGHDYVTDVISFPYMFDKKIKDVQPFGDIFICFSVAKENSKIYNHTVLQEMLMYAVHGALHLAGMDDATKKERAAMDEKAGKIIKQALL